MGVCGSTGVIGIQPNLQFFYRKEYEIRIEHDLNQQESDIDHINYVTQIHETARDALSSGECGCSPEICDAGVVSNPQKKGMKKVLPSCYLT